MLMSQTHYLPSEELKYSNYPEIYEMMDKINDFQRLLEPIISAVSDYNLGTTDGIYVNIAEVENVRDLSFDITDTLGAAQKVCYDVLMPIRDAQESLNELIFSHRYEKSPIVFDKQRIEVKRISQEGV